MSQETGSTMDKYKKILKMVGLSIIVMVLALPIIIGCFYALPAADDFTNGVGWRRAESGLVLYLLDKLKTTYMTWQGTYLGIILAGIPIYDIGGLVGLRIWLLLSAILFVVSLILALSSFYSYFQISKDSITLILTTLICIFFYLFNKNELGETFFWFTSVCVYTVPISCSLFSFYFYFKYRKKPTRGALTGGIIFAFMGAGGALDVAALFCSLYVLGILYQVVVSRKVDRSVWMSLAAVMGALINLWAPGNYARHERIDSEMRVMKSFAQSIGRMLNRLSGDFRLGFLLLLFLVVFVLGYKKLKDIQISFRYPGFVTLYSFLALIAMDYPVVLGYSGASFPSRCEFVELLGVAIYVTVNAFYWAGWCARKECFQFNKTVLFVLIIVCFLPLSRYMNIDEMMSLTTCKMYLHLASGDYKRVDRIEESIVEQISSSMDKNVTVMIPGDGPNTWTNLQRIGLTEDPEYWINQGVSKYFEKESIVVQYVE